jgi:hypothetical protein
VIGELRIEPSAEVLAAARAWLDQVRPALDHDFLAAYLTGSVLTQGFDPAKSRVTLLIVSRSLAGPTLDAIALRVPAPTKHGPHFEPLFMTRDNIEGSLDSFPIEWTEIQERHMLLEGENIVAALEVSQTYLRVQCEHELRGKYIQLRQAYLQQRAHPAELERTLAAAASGFAALFRTLLRLRGEPVPGTAAAVIERVADVFELDAGALIGVHVVRYGGRRHSLEEITSTYHRLFAALERLTAAIDTLRVP